MKSEIKVLAGVVPSGGSEEKSVYSMPLFYILVAETPAIFGSLVYTCITPISNTIYTWLFPCVSSPFLSLFYGHSWLAAKPTLNLHHLEIQRPNFHTGSHSQVSQHRTWTYLSEARIQSNTGA